MNGLTSRDALRNVVAILRKRRTAPWQKIESLCRSALFSAHGSAYKDSIGRLIESCMRRDADALVAGAMRVVLMMEREEA